MNYKNMKLPEVKDDLGFYFWFGTEMVLVASAVFCLFQSKFDVAVLIFILIKLREINKNLEG